MAEEEEEFGYEEETEEKEGIYSEEGREELTEDEDELPASDEGFAEGYDKGEGGVFCANCRKILKDREIVEEIGNKQYKVCSVECANEFATKKSEQEEE